MTLVVDRPVDGPAAHALVIGVSYYRHLPGGAGPVLTNSLGLAQLTAPELSVRQVVSFLADEYRNSDAPLATVDLLTTSMRGSVPQTVSGDPLESPTMGNVKAAVYRWFERCNSPGNIAIFYFCGHGIERDSQYLLMEDFGAFEPALLDNALNLNAFHAGLAQCAAGTQLFFIDACREVPRELKQLVTGTGQGILDSRLDGNLSRDAPILWAAAQGRKAFARKGESTQYAQALLQALRGAGAAQDAADGDRWTVHYNNLAGAVGQLLRNTSSAAVRQEVRTGGEAGDALVHELAGPPSVPVIVNCDPDVCAEITRLKLESRTGGQSYLRDPGPGAWELVALPNQYTLEADVEPPYCADGPKTVWVLPPLRRFKMAVRQ